MPQEHHSTASVAPRHGAQSSFVITGSVKWYDPERELGFVIPHDEGVDEEVAIFGGALRASGHHDLRQGAMVRCQVSRRERGLYARKVLSVDNRTAAPAITTKTHVSVKPDFGPERMVVKWYNRDFGYGFFERPGQADVFVHAETVKACGYTGLEPGDRASVRYGEGVKGLMAADFALG